MHFDRLLTEARLATMVAGDDGYGVIEKAALGIKDGRITWIGPMDAVPGEADQVDRLASRWVTPALIDCHTHLVFAGDRSDEFERRLGGESYESIARSGGDPLAQRDRAKKVPKFKDAAHLVWRAGKQPTDIQCRLSPTHVRDQRY